MSVSPSSALATLRPDLGSFAEFDLQANIMGSIGLGVLPPLEAGKPADKFGKFLLAELLKIEDDLRQSDGSYNRGTWKFTDDSFSTTDRGFEQRVDDRDSRRFAEYFDLEQAATQRARHTVILNYEKRVAAAVFNTTTWTGASLTTAIGTNWDAGGTPMTDVSNAAIRVRNNCGQLANTVILDWELFRKLLLNAEIVDRLKYNGIFDVRPSAMSAQGLAQVFNVDRVLVANMMKNTALEGQAAVLAATWDKTMCMVCRTPPPNSSIEEIGIGRTIHWADDASEIGGFVEVYRDDARRGDIVRCRMEVAEKIIYPAAGHLLTAVL